MQTLRSAKPPGAIRACRCRKEWAAARRYRAWRASARTEAQVRPASLFERAHMQPGKGAAAKLSLVPPDDCLTPNYGIGKSGASADPVSRECATANGRC